MLFEKITMLDYGRPLRDRLRDRRIVGPYTWTPSEPNKGRGFYQGSKGLYCDPRGSTFDLRLELANDHLPGSRLADINGYYVDSLESDTYRPIVARLPKGRGFLAGATMGAAMCAFLDGHIWETIEDAARGAHSEAEDAAERNREAEEQETEEEDEE